jgi:putative RNA 2'-phosphotransferase
MEKRQMKDQVKTSRFLSLVLRHQPEAIGITLDDEGWVDIQTLIAAASKHGNQFDRDWIERVVRENDKQRFAISDDGQRIRANQGHSLRDVDLKLVRQQPPEILYQGTVARFLDSIRGEGLKKQSRNHVHLSEDLQTASKVAQRRGKPVILTIRAGEMHRAGHAFFQSENGVWLADTVPVQFINFPDE